MKKTISISFFSIKKKSPFFIVLTIQILSFREHTQVFRVRRESQTSIIKAQTRKQVVRVKHSQPMLWNAFSAIYHYNGRAIHSENNQGSGYSPRRNSFNGSHLEMIKRRARCVNKARKMTKQISREVELSLRVVVLAI